jgi:hypothetical protein
MITRFVLTAGAIFLAVFIFAYCSLKSSENNCHTETGVVTTTVQQAVDTTSVDTLNFTN